MKKFNFSLLAVFALALSVAFISSCGDDGGGGGGSFTEADYVGTYYGKHTISDPTLLSVINGIDPTTGGAFNDTIEVSSGASTSDNILEFTSTLLSGTTILADISDVSGGNAIEKRIDSLRLSDSAQVDVKNATVKQSSILKASGGNTFEATLNIAGEVWVAGSKVITLSNIPTKGTFRK